jgi:hypothetical protein
MGIRQHSVRLRTERTFLLAIVLATPACVLGAEPLETIREAFRASSQGLTSGVGSGTYRHYRAFAGGDWQLKVDADVSTYFVGRRYHIDLVLHRDDLRKNVARRIIYDGEAVTEAWFTPSIHPTGAQAHISRAIDDGDGLSRPWNGVFRLDVAQLSRSVCDPERLTRGAGAMDLQIAQTSQGELVVTRRLVGRDWIRIQCPGRFGFNIAHLQHVGEGQKEPAREVRVEWKQSLDGLWYIRSVDETLVLRNEKGAIWRVRNVLKYTQFEPNAKVAPKMFTEESLGLPSKSRITDGRPGAKERERQWP